MIYIPMARCPSKSIEEAVEISQCEFQLEGKQAEDKNLHEDDKIIHFIQNVHSNVLNGNQKSNDNVNTSIDS